MRLDAHHSFSQRYPLAVLETILKRNRFDGSVLLAPSIPDSLPTFVRAIVIETPAVDPHLLDDWQRHPLFRGVSSSSGDFAELARRGLTLDVPDPLTVPSLAERHPDLPIAIQRLGDPAALAAAARYPNVHCKLSDLIGQTPDPWRAEDLRPRVHHAIDIFGPQRLMFGSGWPARLPAHAWKETLAAFTQSIGARTQEFREEILGGAATRFYRIAE